MKPPSPNDVLAARMGAELTQAQAAAVVYVTPRTWQTWEATSKTRRTMPAGLFELFCIKTGV